MYCTASVSLIVAGTYLTPYYLLLFIKISEINIMISKVKVKVKQSCYRPGVAQRVPGI